MRLTWPQALVLLATFAWLGAMILDVAQIINPPNWVWFVVIGTLLVASWAVGPSMAEIRRASRRGGRP